MYLTPFQTLSSNKKIVENGIGNDTQIRKNRVHKADRKTKGDKPNKAFILHDFSYRHVSGKLGQGLDISNSLLLQANSKYETEFMQQNNWWFRSVSTVQ